MAFPGMWLLAALLAPAPSQSLALANVRADRFALEPGDSTLISFRLDQDALASVRIYDASDRLVATLLHDRPRREGQHVVVWDGLDDQHEPVPGGPYFYTVSARDEAGQEVVADLTDTTRGEDTLAEDVAYDPALGLITYYLRKPSMVRIRCGIQDGPLLATPVDWQVRLSGPHSEAWDGFDRDHLIQVGQHREVSVTVQAYHLPQNTLLVAGPAPAHTVEPPAPPDRRRPPVQHKMYQHSQHLQHECYDPAVSLVTREATAAGHIPVKIELGPRDQGFLVNQRFEAVFYVDGVFLEEEEMGYLPYTYLLDTSRLVPGEYVFTVNLLGYEGHFGVGSTRLTIPSRQDD